MIIAVVIGLLTSFALWACCKVASDADDMATRWNEGDRNDKE